MKLRYVQWDKLDQKIREWGGDVHMQHYTRNTVSAAAWCPKCRAQTQHRIDDRRVGPCLDCLNRPLPEPVPPAVPEPGLFDEFDEQIARLRGHR
jgi:hypothetical protein